MELVLDFIDVMSQLRRRQKRYLALLLRDLEGLLGPDSEEFQIVRKLVLDYFNDFLRSTAQTIFGEDVEGLV